MSLQGWSAFIGVIAAFWHVLLIEGVLLVSGVVEFALYVTYYRRLERDKGITSH